MFGIILLFQTCPLSDQKGMHICYTKADQVSSMYLEKHLPHSIPGPFIVYIWHTGTSWSQLPDSLALLHRKQPPLVTLGRGFSSIEPVGRRIRSFVGINRCCIVHRRAAADH